MFTHVICVLFRSRGVCREKNKIMYASVALTKHKIYLCVTLLLLQKYKFIFFVNFQRKYVKFHQILFCVSDLLSHSIICVPENNFGDT